MNSQNIGACFHVTDVTTKSMAFTGCQCVVITKLSAVDTSYNQIQACSQTSGIPWLKIQCANQHRFSDKLCSYQEKKKKLASKEGGALIMSELVWLTLTSLDVLKVLGLLFHFFGSYFQNKQSVFMYNFLPNMTHQNSSDKLCYTGQLECQYSHLTTNSQT